MVNIESANQIVGDTPIKGSDETILLVIKFRIGRNLRFLSHAEMLKVFQRACVRGGIAIQHSQGFNPHPRLSLPLPRPVGVEAEDDILCLYLDEGRTPVPASPVQAPQVQASDLSSSIKSRFSEQLPEGLEVRSVDVVVARRPPRPLLASYVLNVKPEYVNLSTVRASTELSRTSSGRSNREHLISRVNHLLASERLLLKRQVTKRNSKFKEKEIDVRPYLESIELKGSDIVIKCKVGPAGSIRVEEILELLELKQEDLASPIKRKDIEWE